MFCPQCGIQTIQTAKFCHNCSKELPTSPSNSSSSTSSYTNAATGTGPPGKRSHNKMSFQDYRRKKEQDRSSRFSSSGKKLKGPSSDKKKEVTIQIGIMKMSDNDDVLKFIRGSNLPLKTISNIASDDLLAKAVAKHSLFNKDILNKPVAYKLLYPDKTQLSYIFRALRNPLS
ncbi:hypothetical protein QZH41_003690 [Actinostola sp. cb2023]|nr:hypothetical protein QZH41_003690 [Actinostola sp. cb2023]